MSYLGELAAIGTSLCFSIGPAFFTLAGKEVGSIVVNRSRLVVALVYLSIFHWLFYGSFFPIAPGNDRWLWFTISGVVGLTLGDAGLFQAFVMIGPRLTMLVYATSPVMGALLGWAFLGETLNLWQIIGIIVTLCGVSWVVLGQENEVQKSMSRRNYTLGIFFALLGALGQSIGLFAAKVGLEGNYPALSGQIMRMFSATVAIWLWTFFVRQGKHTFHTLKDHPTAVKNILLASFIGPTLGVWFSLVSVQHTDLGIASTLQSLQPVFLIPIGYFFFNEKVTWQSVAGTLVTLAGVAILFLV
jgi:drug/metabolite transporter (DMT)-like permease